MSRRHIYKWVQRFVQQELEGLQDKPDGVTHLICPDQNNMILSPHFVALQPPIPHYNKKPPLRHIYPVFARGGLNTIVQQNSYSVEYESC